MGESSGQAAFREYRTAKPLLEVIDEIKKREGTWGAMAIKRHFLQPITDEAFMMGLRPLLHGAQETHIAFLGDQSIYVVWRGSRKSTFTLLSNFLGTRLLRPELVNRPQSLAIYVDPIANGEELKKLISAEKSGPIALDDEDDHVFGVLGGEEESEEEDSQGAVTLRASREQVILFNQIKKLKPVRRELQFLVVEDQIFAKKLLCEILRGVRLRNNNESPCIEAAQGLQEAWNLFLKNAPDIVFVDLNLADGSGHTLSRAIKEVDPTSHVVVVTANHHEEEVKVAHQNNVDGFITKPYNKKQILDIIERCLLHKSGRGGKIGTSGQF